MEKATVGRVVHLVHPVSKGNDVCRAAMVTRAEEDGSVSLAVFNPNTVSSKHRVKLDAETKKPGTWHFPEPAEETGTVEQAEPASA